MERPYVGIDLHRRRSVIYTMNADGEKLDCVRIANDPLTLLEAVGKAGADAEVVIEATYASFHARGPLSSSTETMRAQLGPPSRLRALIRQNDARAHRFGRFAGVPGHGGCDERHPASL